MSKRRDEEGRAVRREELLDAATVAIRRDGPHVSMDVIAAEAGITKPILYRHFGDRAGLVAALGERFAADLMRAIAGQLAQPDQPRELVSHTIDAFVSFIEREPNVYRYLVEQALVQRPDALQGFIREVAAQVAVVIGERLRDIGADSGAAEPWAVGIVGMVHFAGDWWQERRTMPRERLVTYLTDLLWGGFAGLGFAAASIDVPTAAHVAPAAPADR